ncbi:MAG TPA: DUF892 family protein [Chitinophagaceae bacterium]|nr:DUF892 family protein [Chitinophagaceae bacterium]
METMINLNDLLKHEILDLYSVEEQIIEAMPAMIEKAKNPELKKALREHLKITEEQKSRLDKVKQTFGEGDGQNGDGGDNKGFFSRLFGGGSGGGKCKGMAGIISEGEKIMAADITDEALDAAIIASAQKIEHYEICGYGTARAFARELQLPEVERMLTQTLNEEYQADDLLTALAVGKLNLEAERADGMEGSSSGRSNRTGGGGSKGGSKSSGGGSSKSSSKGSSKGGSKSSVGGKGGSSKGGSSKRGSKSGGGSSKGGGSKSSSKNGSSKGSSKRSKGSSKGGSSRGGSKSGGGRGGNKGSSKGGSSRGRGR